MKVEHRTIPAGCSSIDFLAKICREDKRTKLFQLDQTTVSSLVFEHSCFHLTMSCFSLTEQNRSVSIEWNKEFILLDSFDGGNTFTLENCKTNKITYWQPKDPYPNVFYIIEGERISK